MLEYKSLISYILHKGYCCLLSIQSVDDFMKIEIAIISENENVLSK